MKRLLAALLVFAGLSFAPAHAADPLSSLRFLVGSWNCTYAAGRQHVYYRATFAYALSGNWMRESDVWHGGGTDFGMFTYEPKRHAWTAIFMEPERSSVIFRGDGAPNRIVYRSVYPDSTMTEVFQRTSPVRYTLHFTQSAGRTSTRSTDVCVKK